MEELGDIEIDSTGTAEYLSIAGPTKTFVTLRAVGRNVQIITLLSPYNVVIQLIDFF